MMVKRTAADRAGAEDRLDRSRLITRLSEQLGRHVDDVLARRDALFDTGVHQRHIDRPSVGMQQTDSRYGRRRRMFGTIVLVIAGLFFSLTAWRSASAPAEFAARLGLNIA